MTRTHDLLITKRHQGVECLIRRTFRAFSAHDSLLKQQVLSVESMRSFRVVGQRVGQG